ncbi:MAG: lysophospholipase [Oscillospiraceae bacterium]|nr:lysophospholipase [Oscillospiraceae bacterium]
MSDIVTIILIIALCLVAFGLFMAVYAPWRIFVNTLYRDDKKERTRTWADASCDEHKHMFTKGMAWAAQYKDITVPLHIVNEGLNLFGEYIDFGYDRCAIVLQGRTESLLYSYYYADIYAENGYNILVIDTRAHGLSDGKYITAGIKECDDLLLWIDHIKTKFNVTSFVIHGICIGAATAVYACCAQKGKGERLIQSLVLDGLYTSYYEIFKNHIIERKRPVLYFVYITFFYLYLCTGVNLLKKTPFQCVGGVDVPVLFIWSEKDPYCFVKESKELYARCESKEKEIRFFPHGRHSFVKYHNLSGYNQAIQSFLNKANP